MTAGQMESAIAANTAELRAGTSQLEEKFGPILQRVLAGDYQDGQEDGAAETKEMDKIERDFDDTLNGLVVNLATEVSSDDVEDQYDH